MSAVYHVAAEGTTVVASAAAVLHTLTIGTAGASAVITLYDGTTTDGPTIAVITPSTPINLVLDAPLANGLTVDVAAAASDLTIVLE